MPAVEEKLIRSANGVHAPHKNLRLNNRVIEFINDDRTKKTVNILGNGVASALNLITFINTNWRFMDADHEFLKKASEIWTKVATGSQGLIGTIDLWNKKNIIPLLGNALEVPIAVLSSGYNLWLFRGVSQGLGQFLRAIDQREITGKDGKPQIIGGNFKERGWVQGFETTITEIPKMIVEVCAKPSNLSKLSHSLTLTSTFQAIGGTIGLCGFHQVGALIRNISGIGVDFSLMRDEGVTLSDEQKNKAIRFLGTNLSSIFTKAGWIFIGAAVSDEAKRLPFFADKDVGLSNLSYFFDRGASVLYTIGNLSIKSEGKNVEAKKRAVRNKAARNPSMN